MILCADDFGMAEDINRAVVELVDAGKLSAVSCAVAHPLCGPECLAPLAARRGKVDLGLHLVLTDEGRPAADLPLRTLTSHHGFHRFRTLLGRSYRRALDPEEVQHEVQAQFERFAQWVGQPPDFIDGHLHVHQLPVVRDALLEFVAALPLTQRPYLRNTHMPLDQLLRTGTSLAKNMMISRPGTVLRQAAARLGLKTNPGFAGVYNYTPHARFGPQFALFLAQLPAANAILMVHPGLKEPWRRQEYEVLRAWQPGNARPQRWQLSC